MGEQTETSRYYPDGTVRLPDGLEAWVDSVMEGDKGDDPDQRLTWDQVRNVVDIVLWQLIYRAADPDDLNEDAIRALLDALGHSPDCVAPDHYRRVWQEERDRAESAEAHMRLGDGLRREAEARAERAERDLYLTEEVEARAVCLVAERAPWMDTEEDIATLMRDVLDAWARAERERNRERDRADGWMGNCALQPCLQDPYNPCEPGWLDSDLNGDEVCCPCWARLSLRDDTGACVGCGNMTNGWFPGGDLGPGWYCGWCHDPPHRPEALVAGPSVLVAAPLRRVDEPMRALTVKQPHASLIVAGLKPVENRTWAVPSTLPQYRRCPGCNARYYPGFGWQCPGSPEDGMGHVTEATVPDGPFPFRLAIHSAKTTDLEASAQDWDQLRDALSTWPPLWGAILGTVQVTGCHHADDCRWYERAVHDDGRRSARLEGVHHCSPWAEPNTYHWTLANPVELPEPIPWRGRQGLWNLPDDALAEVSL